MNTNALFKISYGLYVLIAKENDFDNGCIINTFTQVTNTPNRVAVVVNKTNKTADMIRKTGVFNVSVISSSSENLSLLYGHIFNCISLYISLYKFKFWFLKV